nr:AI-2E family transporter [Sulfurovaceae bacterium]
INDVNIYFLTKTVTSLATGFLVFIMLLFFELDYALLFGFLAFILNYIPSIGSLIAAIPALFIAITQLTIIETSSIAFGYIVINNLIGNFIEPKILGRGLGLSTLVVFLSMIFWGWILGSIGMFLAIPLTIVVKMACDNSSTWHWVSVLLSDFVADDENKIQN